MIRKRSIVFTGVALGFAFLLLEAMPDIRRYLKMRRM